MLSTLSPSRQIKDPVMSISLPSFEMKIIITGEGKGVWNEALRAKPLRASRAL